MHMSLDSIYVYTFIQNVHNVHMHAQKQCHVTIFTLAKWHSIQVLYQSYQLKAHLLVRRPYIC